MENIQLFLWSCWNEESIATVCSRICWLICEQAGQYGVTGFACGVVGQGIASSIMTLKR